ncbi:MAG TPA: NADH-quinone oxidoreductase subunit NuoG [Terriglobia bacterium]|nr:NADH-quinone oxidoreductase subunit NuoG [Terriglobia bacterium]
MKEGLQNSGYEALDHPLKEENRQSSAPYTRSAALTPGPVAKKGSAPEPVKFTIDGKAVTAPVGTLLIEAAKQVGIEIPSYCYYPNLTLQGACRMCLVAIERMPKLQTACTTVVTNGMVVHTETEEVKNARKAMLEFLLTNHPLDCPVCDKGGECELQDAVFRYGAAETRFMESKLHHDERKFSSLVYYDWPRCILCYRCVRVCDEGMDVNAYGIGFRGAHSEIIPNRGEQLECEECGMCIDICPVGALTSGTYRYHTRPWEMTYTGTICNHCGDGCKTTLSVRNNQIIRANNRDHSGFNGEFLCVKGRFGWDFVNHDKRLTAPLIRRKGKQETGTWDEALGLTVERLKTILAENGPDSLAVIGSSRTTNEEDYLLGRFTRTILATNNLDHHRTADYPSLVRALTESHAADRHAAMEDILQASSILLVGNDPTHQHPLTAFQIRQAVQRHGARLYIINHQEIKLRRQASLYITVEPQGEPDTIRRLAGGEISSAGLDCGADPLSSLREKLRKESDTIIIFGDEIQGAAIRDLVRWGLTLPGRTRFIALGDYANSRGAADMGLLPGTLPGYSPIMDDAARARFESAWETKIPAQPGRHAGGIIAGIESGEVKALLVFGSNPAKTFGIPNEALGKLEFLMVAEIFPTETTEMADVVLAATSFAEKSGTVTNTCGQVQALKKTMRKAGTRSDLEILLTLARLFGHRWNYQSTDDVTREIIAKVPGYAVPLPSLLVGRAVATRPEGMPPELERPDLVFSSRDSLFTSGSISRYSWALNSVDEARKPYGHIF